MVDKTETLFKFLDKKETKYKDEDNDKVIRICNNDLSKTYNKIQNIINGIPNDKPIKNDPNMICGYMKNVLVYKNQNKHCIYIHNVNDDIIPNIFTLLYALRTSDEWGEFNKINVLNISLFGDAREIILKLVEMVNKFTFIKVVEFDHVDRDKFYDVYKGMMEKNEI
jgi:hypothetical protein